ncbi:MAG: AI-2E family transporter [Tyzzerella sp.]|nr:AI-2E family transporter [Tyzzerella sp.]
MNYYDKKPTFGETGSSKIKEHFRKGITVFLIIGACIICYFAFLRFEYISEFVGEILGIVRPIVYGFVVAYLLNPIVKLVERYVKLLLGKVIKNEKWIHKIGRSTGILIAFIVAAALLTALFNMVIPELIRSIGDLFKTLPGQIEEFIDYVSKLQEGDQPINKFLENVLRQGSETLEEWAKTDLLKQTNVLMTSAAVGVINVISGVFDVLVGLIVAVYVLFSKEQFQNQGRKIIYALMPAKRANLTLHIARKSNEIFGGFIIGKIIDSAIIGVLCFIGVSLLKMPYALLVSVIVGVTNVIPFFGPYIGAIPSAILILLADPIKGVYFIIFILLLQQLDGNVIGPMILGDSTGLSAFWVVFAILLGGGLFGIVGMIIGVPTFAMIYYIAKLFVAQRLEEKKLPTTTSSYDGVNYVDDNGKYVEVQNEDATGKVDIVEEKKGE